MKVLTAPLWELAEFEEGKALLDRSKGHVAFSGLYDSQKLHMVYGLSDGFTQKIIVTFSDKRAREKIQGIILEAYNTALEEPIA